MPNTHIKTPANIEHKRDSGIWTLWPLSLLSKRVAGVERAQDLLDSQLAAIQQKRESIIDPITSIQQEIKKIEQVTLQHQQNNNVEFDRLHQDLAYLAEKKIQHVEMSLKTLQQQSARMLIEMESAISRVVDGMNSLQRQRVVMPGGQIPQSVAISKPLESDLKVLSEQSVNECVVELMRDEIVALQIQVRAQSLQLAALAALSGVEHSANAASANFDRHSTGEFRRLSSREQNLALQLQALAQSPH